MFNRLLARYDNAALRPPTALANESDWSGPPASAMEVWVRLKTWCFEGAHDVRVHGAVTKTPPVPFSVALLRVGSAAERRQLAEALCQDLDGSVRLASCPEGIARLVFRLRVKLDESLPGRARRLTDPWDCGYAKSDPEGQHSLARFMPRRATLIVALALPEAALRECLCSLMRAGASYTRPVRLLIVEGEAPMPWTDSALPGDLVGVPFTLMD